MAFIRFLISLMNDEQQWFKLAFFCCCTKGYIKYNLLVDMQKFIQNYICFDDKQMVIYNDLFLLLQRIIYAKVFLLLYKRFCFFNAHKIVPLLYRRLIHMYIVKHVVPVQTFIFLLMYKRSFLNKIIKHNIQIHNTIVKMKQIHPL